jgi:hypothetical protein
MMLTQGNIGFLLQGATGKHSVFFFSSEHWEGVSILTP